MMEILFTVGQILWAVALAYGAYLVLTHAGSLGLRLPGRAEHDEMRPDLEKNEIWKKYRDS
jgi:hypothetical protein